MGMEWLGQWRGKTLADLLDHAVARYPGREALVYGDLRMTYSELGNQVDALARGLVRIGIQPGDKVAVWLSNRPEWFLVEFAAAGIGAVMVPLSTRFKAYDLEYILKQSDASALVMMDEFLKIDYLDIIRDLIPELDQASPHNLRSGRLPLLDKIICTGRRKLRGMYDFGDLAGTRPDERLDRDIAHRRTAIKDDDVINIPYTSGTTGFPKGVLTTHRQYIGETVVFRDRLRIEEGDRFLAPAPFFANFGNYFGILLPMLVGGCSVPLPFFDAGECLRLIEKEHCTHFTGTPTMYLDILNHPDLDKAELHSLRTGMSGAGPASVKMVEDVRSILGIRVLCNGYGMTENSGATTMTSYDDAPEIMAHTTGRPFPDVDIKIVDTETGALKPTGEIGELCTRGWIVMQGYYKKPEETARCFDEEGWFHTTDLGYLDSQGNFCITGRLKDMFISGGTNVYPTEIENFLYTHPKVKQVAVIGVPDARMGEVGFAFVILKPGCEADEAEIRRFCKERIANYKVPRYVHFVDEIPLAGVGKIQKFKLEEEARRELEQRGALSSRET